MTASPDNNSLYKSAEGYKRVMAFYDRTLEKLGIPYETRYLETSFGLTHTVVSGDQGSKPVVLWHGLNANATTWMDWISALAPSYRLYAVDTIGGLGKSAPSRPSKRGAAYGKWAAEVLEGFSLRRANLVGASNGGWLIVKLASVAPQMIGSAVLLSASGFAPLNLAQALRITPGLLFKPPDQAARRLSAALSPPDMPPDSDTLELLELVLRHFRGEANPIALKDEEIGTLTAPTYLLMGQYESLVDPYKVIRRGVRLLSNLIAAEIVPGVGHSMVHQQPDWVIARVARFLEVYGV
jgi:pimeloyl-ACP methyl ester carboxylesterase